MKNIIEVKNLTKKFGKHIAVDSISFSVSEGEFLGFLGSNGAGKTTTIQMMLGMIEPTEGRINMLGGKMPKDRVSILKQANFSSSYVRLPFYLTVYESLYIFSLLYEVENPKKKIIELLELLEIGYLIKKRGNQLSSGERTRVHLCKALINDPKLLFLDEPTSSLDPDIAQSVRKYLKKIQKEKNVTVFLTSHNMAEVEELCDRVIFLSNGRIVAEDTPLELAHRITDTRVNFMMVDGQKRTLALAQKNKWPVTVAGRYTSITIAEKEIAYLLAAMAEMNIEYKEISIEKPSLEDYFLNISKKGKKK